MVRHATESQGEPALMTAPRAGIPAVAGVPLESVSEAVASHARRCWAASPPPCFRDRPAEQMKIKLTACATRSAQLVWSTSLVRLMTVAL